jgi:hypothetical protein
MRQLLTSIWIITAPVALALALLSGTPFEAARQRLDTVFGAEPAWTQVTHLYQNPELQEKSHGEQPVHSLSTLASSWGNPPRLRRILFMGNSQMFAMSLAPGEGAPKGEEMTYTDLVAEHYRHGAMSNVACYRLAAPGMTYTEMLWYLTYFLNDPDLKPEMLLVQVNYQAFWNGNIRDGMLPMLRSNPNFRTEIQRMASDGKPYSSDFIDALRRYDEESALQSVAAPWYQPGTQIESRMRDFLKEVPAFDTRHQHKDSLMDLLYSGRVYLLHLTPTTARSITGARLSRSQAALEKILQLATSEHVRILLFNSPVNPRVSLYRTEADRKNYRDFLLQVTQRYQVELVDFECEIPAALWGRWMSTPDPLHMGRAGHHKMADLMIRLIDANK